MASAKTSPKSGQTVDIATKDPGLSGMAGILFSARGSSIFAQFQTAWLPLGRQYDRFDGGPCGDRTRDTRIKRCGMLMLFYVVRHEIRTFSPATIQPFVSTSINHVIDWWRVWLQDGCNQRINKARLIDVCDGPLTPTNCSPNCV